MTHGNEWRDAQREKRQQLTTLNVLTTIAYNACEANGGHEPSGETVMRDFSLGPQELQVCARCSVPIRSGVPGWNALAIR